MNLQGLLARAAEIDQAISNTADQHKALVGHRTEVGFWIDQLKDAAKDLEEVVEPQEETHVE